MGAVDVERSVVGTIVDLLIDRPFNQSFTKAKTPDAV